MTLYRFRWILPFLTLTACARGCEGPEPQLPAVTDAGATAKDDPNRLPVERELDVQLADRRGGAILPSMAMLPYRRLTQFEANKHFVARLDEHSLRILERQVAGDSLGSDDAITTSLRMAAQDYRDRAGVEPDKLVFVIDSRVQAELGDRVRSLALKAGPWKLACLAREGEQLVELSLTPPVDRRPPAGLQAEPTPARN